MVGSDADLTKSCGCFPAPLLGCIPSSSPVAENSKFEDHKTPVTSDDDDQEDNRLEDQESFTKFSKFIDEFLTGSDEDGPSGKLGAAAFFLSTSSGWLKSMSSGSKIVYEKLQGKEFKLNDISQTAADIFRVMGKVHWAAAGLLLVAMVIQNAQKAGNIHKECLEFLRSINRVGKSLSKLIGSSTLSQEIQSTVDEGTRLMAKSAACCLYIIHQPKWRKSFCTGSNENQIKSCWEQLKIWNSDLHFQLTVESYVKSHDIHGEDINKSKSKGHKVAKKSEDVGDKQQEQKGSTREKDKAQSVAGSSDQVDKGNVGGKDKVQRQKGPVDEGQKPSKRRIGAKCIDKFGVNWKTICRGCPTEETEEFNFADDTEPLTEVMNMLEVEEQKIQNNKTVAVFLCGGKDAGKTALAEQVCSNLNDKGWSTVRIEVPKADETKQESKANTSLVSAVRSKISDSFDLNGEPENKNGQQKLKDDTGENKVLIYVDNVPGNDFVEKVLPKSLPRKARVRLLLTIREKNVSSAMRGSRFKTKVHVMKRLSYTQASQVLKEKLQPNVDQDLVGQITKICQGYRRRITNVREHLIQYYKNEDFTRLKHWISFTKPDFDQLNDYLTTEKKFLKLSTSSKETLLDICSFFKGWEWDETTCIEGGDILQKLKDFDLVKRVSNKISVPETVMPFCLSLAKENRITNGSELRTVLSKKKADQIKGIWLLENKFPLQISSEELEEMHSSLRILALGDWTVVKDRCTEIFPELRYLQVGSVPNLPFHISKLTKLRFLENNSEDDMGIGNAQDSLAQKGFAKKTFEFFNDKWYFVDATGRPFYPSTLNEDTTLAVLFNIPYEKEELQGLETILDALLTTSNFLKIVHVGYFVNAFAKLAIRHCVYTSDDYEAKLFFENILAEVESFEEKGSSAMIVCEVKTSEVGKKGFSPWRSISNESLKAMTSNVPKSEFLRWKQLIHTPSEINIEVLRKMLFTKEKEMKINSLLISCPGDTEKHELERLMNEVKDKNQLGWVPIISFGRGTRAIQNQEVGSLTWASVVDPGRINPIAMHVFRVYYVLKKLPLIINLSCHGNDG